MPSSRWHLSEAGRLRCHSLAKKIAEYHPDIIVASTEPKACETAEIVADVLGATYETVEGLHEHRRDNVGWLDRRDFERGIAELFAKPDHIVFGQETATQAHDRFAATINRLLERHVGKDIVVVTHGTVLTLFVSRALGLEPLFFWKQLGLPGFIVLSLPGLALLDCQSV